MSEIWYTLQQYIYVMVHHIDRKMNRYFIGNFPLIYKLLVDTNILPFQKKITKKDYIFENIFQPILHFFILRKWN